MKNARDDIYWQATEHKLNNLNALIVQETNSII
jgi:hypothetical protein